MASYIKMQKKTIMKIHFFMQVRNISEKMSKNVKTVFNLYQVASEQQVTREDDATGLLVG